MLITAVLSASLAAQSPPSQNAPELEVASIRLNPSFAPAASVSVSPGGLLTFANVTFRYVIQRAYGLRPSQVVGGPDWLDSENYDLIVRTGKPGAPEQLMPVLQTLLAARLKLVLRKEARETSVFALVLAGSDRQLGPQLRASSMVCGMPQALAPPGERPICGGRSGVGFISAGGVTMDELARSLSPMVERPIVDRTGLTGGFDLDMKWAAERFPGPGPGRTSFLTALLEQQLGLSLQPTRAALDFLVVERVERPTDN
jgi:uncharacterized protein (TIGR03435 family)